MKPSNIILFGGAGFVGARLTQLLLDSGYNVTVYDLFLYDDSLSFLKSHRNISNLKIIKGDIRDIIFISSLIHEYDTVIHLACISNDPSFDLNPTLSKSINYDCFEPLVKLCANHKVNRFIYASSSSVYGVKDVSSVTENLETEPLTDYSLYKSLCEKILLRYHSPSFNVTILRPSTVCGNSPRLRLDVVVNILTMHAYYNKVINIFGGNQLRPNIHIEDMCKAYIKVLSNPKFSEYPVFNIGSINLKVSEIGDLVNKHFGGNLPVKIHETNDNRSYHTDSSKFYNFYDFTPERTVSDAISDLCNFFDTTNRSILDNSIFFNIKRMKDIGLI